MLRAAVAVLLIALLPSYVRADARFALLIGTLPMREYVMIACPTALRIEEPLMRCSPRILQRRLGIVVAGERYLLLLRLPIGR